MERDLHDGAQQRLVLLNLQLGVLGKRLAGDAVALPLVTELRENLAAALAELRALAHGIYPAVLESEGLPGALREAVARAGMSAQLSCEGVGRYAPELEAAIYFCCLEALQNAAKHAGADAAVVVALRLRGRRPGVRGHRRRRGFDVDAALQAAPACRT